MSLTPPTHTHTTHTGPQQTQFNPSTHTGKPLTKFVNSDNQHLVSPEAIDLLVSTE